LRYERLALTMQVCRAALEPCPTRGDSVSLNGLLDGVCASPAGLSKPKVVIRRDVEGAGFGAGELLGRVVVFTGPVKDDDGATCDTCDRLREAIVDAQLEATGIKGVKI
jgi:hypothetical protein